MAKPKITFVLPSLRGGGAERVVLNIIRELERKSHSIDLVLVEASGEFLDDVPSTITIINLGAKRTYRSIFHLIKYLSTHKPQIVFPSLPHISVVTLVARFLSNSKCVVIPIEHNTLSQSALHATTFRGRLLPYFMRIAYRLADHIIAVSAGVGNDLVTMVGINRSHLSIIYNPVISQKLIESSYEAPDHPWFVNSKYPVILGAGRFTPAKGFDVLINAFALLRKSRPARLILIGDGPERESLETQIVSHGLETDVSMPGFVSNPYVYFRQSSIFVLSSIWEGLPTVLVEALACGTRIISTDCPSGPKEILENGRWGVLVPVGDIASLAKQMSTLLDQPKPKSFPTSWSKFTVDNSAKAYEELVREILK